MTITESITGPLQRYVDGAGHLDRFPIIQAAQDLIAHGEARSLHTQMVPFYTKWIYCTGQFDRLLQSVISDIARIDPYFCGWATQQDLIKIAHAWAVKGDGERTNKVLENENKVLKVENDELKAFVDDTIPYSEIEAELLELPPKTVGSVFTIQNDMLGGNEVWQRHFKDLRNKVRKREKENEVPQIDARHIIMTGSDATYNENNDKEKDENVIWRERLS